MSDANEDKTGIYAIISEGDSISRYRIVHKIGAGGMGEVYLAEDESLGRRVALKFLPMHLNHEGEVRTRFLREAQAAAGLDHPNIVTVHEVGEHEDRPYFAMQYVEGRTLQELAYDIKLTEEQILFVAIQVAEGLSRAHKSGVIHRDIKSANVMIDDDFHVTILDFGLAAVEGSQQITAAGVAIGTAAYMSPEQARGATVDHRSDLFSLGSVLYELVAGRTPFLRDNAAATIHAISTEDSDPIEAGEHSPELLRIITRCLAKSPEERYQSAADLAADLRFVSSSSRFSSRIAPPPDVKPSIAVLPFINTSADAENEYFADGLTEEILGILAKDSGLKVTSRTSSFAFKGKQEDLREIGRKLGVKMILEGSVRKAGNRVRITVQLLNTEDGFHLWSETFDRVLEDVFAVQDEIAAAVGEAMNVTLLPRNAVGSPSDPETHELEMRARLAAFRQSESGLQEALNLYDQVLERDQANARALAGKARALLVSLAYGHEARGGFQEVVRIAQQALDVDSESAEANEVMAVAVGAFDFEFQKSLEYGRRAFELAPNSSHIAGSLAVIEFFLGNFEETYRLSNLAVELDPMNPAVHFDHGRILLNSNRITEARKYFTRAFELSPDLTGLSAMLAFVSLREGCREEALAWAQKEALEGYRQTSLCIVYHAMGNEEESRKALEIVQTSGSKWAFQIAMCHAARREYTGAIEQLRSARANNDPGIPWAGVHFVFDGLRTDPRMREFLAELNLIN